MFVQAGHGRAGELANAGTEEELQVISVISIISVIRVFSNKCLDVPSKCWLALVPGVQPRINPTINSLHLMK